VNEVVYTPEVFDKANMEEAKKIILTPEDSSMRSQALEYVNDERFAGLSPDVLITMLNKGLKIGSAILKWVLQYIPQPQKQLRAFSSLLEKDGKLFILNKLCSTLSAHMGWIDSKRIRENSFMAGYCSKENV
jgi:hypothetical protein